MERRTRSAKKSVPNRRPTDEFRVGAVRRAHSVAHHEAARRLGVPVTTGGNGARQPRQGGAAPLGTVVSELPSGGNPGHPRCAMREPLVPCS